MREARVVAEIVLAFVVRLFAFISFIVGFVVRLALAGVGFLPDMFPVTGVNSVCKKLHGIESSGLRLVTQYVLDSLSETGVVEMMKNVLIPTSVDGETIELDVVFDNALIVLHLQVVDGVFGISGRINGTKLSAKGDDECRPIVHPRQVVVRVDDGWFKVLQCYATEVGEGKIDLFCIVAISRVLCEVEVAEKDEVVEFLGIRTVKGIRFLGLCLFR